MEDIRRMEDETQKELETVRLPVLWKFSNFPFLKLSVLNKFRLTIRKSVIESHFLISVSLLNSGFLDTNILLF